jgi:hypothetical protein
MIFTSLMCGIPLLLVGLLATGVSLFHPPPDRVERLTAGACAVGGLIFGPGFLSLIMPARWDAPARLWRWCGWLVALAPVPFATVLLVYPTTSAQHSTRIGSRAAAVVTGLVLLGAAAAIARSWLRSVRAPRD